jgi:hypothetical protein
VPPLINPPADWPGPGTAHLTLDAATPISGLDGHGWITVTIAKDGNARFIGALADGSRWTSSQPLAADGTVPIYAAPYGGKGSLFGIVQVSGSPVTLDATLNWYRPANLPGTRFTAGWPDGVTLDLAGGAWTPFKANVSWPLPGLAATTGAAHLLLAGDTLPADEDWPATFALKTGRALVTPAPSGALATFVPIPGTGAFSGTFKTSAKAAPLPFNGVLLPGSNQARGFLLTPSGSAAVTLLPQ